jgi:hypothetical protein
MSRKVTFRVITQIVADVDEGIEMTDIVNEMDYSFNSENMTVIDTEIVDYAVIDSK